MCAEGVETCADGEYGVCSGDVLPTIELCNNLDDDSRLVTNSTPQERVS